MKPNDFDTWWDAWYYLRDEMTNNLSNYDTAKAFEIGLAIGIVESALEKLQE